MKRKTNLEGASLQYGTGFNLYNDSGVGSFIGGQTGGDEYYQFEAAEVIDVIYNKDHPNFKINEDIGKVKIRLVDRQKDQAEDILIWAWPANSSIIQYPVKREIVNLIQYLGRYFYVNSLNFSNAVNNNTMPGESESPKKDNKDNADQYEKVSNSNIPQREQEGDQSLGNTFKDNNLQIKPILPEEGDVILRGRFGNNIRLGNNSETNLPTIKISVGQSDDINKTEELEHYVENINDDRNSLWITSDETVDLNPITEGKSYYLKSARNTPNTLEGNQVIINSDRIIFNTKVEELMMFANKGVIINSNGYIAIDSAENIGLTTLDKLNIVAKTGTYFDSKEILLGKDAKEPIVLGDQLMELMSDLLSALIKETHMTGAGKSSPPENVASYAKIKSKLRKMLSKQNKSL